MRELTKQEIDNAPYWATHYYVSELGGGDVIHYINKSDLRMALFDGALGFVVANLSKRCQSYIMAKPIPRKPFDISEYEFSDKDILNHFITKDKSRVNFDFDSELMPSDTIGFNKQDAIAIAKHFKLI